MAFIRDTISSLLVPIKLDTLYIPEGGQEVVGPMIDFTKLPYFKEENGGIRAVNPNSPYISETVLSTPLSDKDFQLETGMHVHWALPDALTHATYRNQMTFPTIPNFWLISRKSDAPEIPDAKWIVISNYLWPEGTIPSQIDTSKGIVPPVVAYHLSAQDDVTGIPFRYLGYVQKLTKAEWEIPTEGDYLEDLTAIGYGEPLFAAFYPNCMGILGIHDNEITDTTDLSKIRYELFGWYGQDDNVIQETPTLLPPPSSKDILKVFAINQKDTNSTQVSWLQQLEEELGWTVALQDGDQLPGRAIFFSQVQFTAPSAPANHAVLEGNEAIELCLGNTNTEALSAYLAHKMEADPGTRERIEDQLESLHLIPQLQDKTTDLSSILEEVRHSQSFHPIPAGRIWELKIEDAQAAGMDQLADIYRASDVAEGVVPKEVKHQLHELNLLEEAFQSNVEVIQALQAQIFSDWQKYMHAVYHDPIKDGLSQTGSPYSNIDQSKAHIEKMIALVDYRKAFGGQLRFFEKLEDTQFETHTLVSGTTAFSDLMHLIPKNEEAFISWGSRLDAQKLAEEGLEAGYLAEQISQALVRLDKGLGIFHLEMHKQIRNLEKLLNGQFDALDDASLAHIIKRIRGHDILISQEAFLAQKQLTARQMRAVASIFNKNLSSLRDTYFPYNLVQLITGKTTIEEQLEALKPVRETISHLAKLPNVSLQRIAAPRYWEPREPIILMAGPAAQTTDRHGMDGADSPDGMLVCFRLKQQANKNDNTPILPLDILEKFLAESGNIAVTKTDANPWHSLFFEWEVRVDPIRKHSNVDPSQNNYSSDFLTAHFDLRQSLSEFSIIDDQQVDQLDHYFSGRSIMTPFALDKLEHELDQFLIQETINFIQHKVPSTDKDILQKEQALLDLAPSDPNYDKQWLAYFAKHKDQVVASHNQIIHQASRNPDGQEALSAKTSPIQVALDAIAQINDLKSQRMHIQSQSISGFNHALLMQHLTFQLEIAEPNGFEAYQAFTEKVRQCVGLHNKYAGMPVGSFHPFRTGQIHLNRLRLVDTFGRTFRVLDLAAEPEYLPPIYASQWMRPTQVPNSFNLMPRITQPSRLHFRWLAADGSDVFTSAHPDTSPICGWIIVNRLDAELMIYDGTGEPLGYIESSGRWRVFPGRKWPMLAEQIENDALRKMVNWIMDQTVISEGSDFSFLAYFLQDLDEIMADIDPNTYTHHNENSFLMGRPIALVQAAVDIQLMGVPAVREDLSLFKEMVENPPQSYTDEHFTKVDIPIRIGERKRLNDGLVCYWLDENEGYKDQHFFAPFDEAHGVLKSFEGNKISFKQSLGAAPQKLSILMDPRGLLHCTTGLLPTKSLSLPPRFVTPALEKLQISFLAAPLLTEPQKINLVLPEEAGYSWAWVQQVGSEWHQLTTQLTLRQSQVIEAFEKGEDLWELLLQENWIEIQTHDPEAAFLKNPSKRLGDSPTSLAKSLFPNGDSQQLEKLQLYIETQLMNLASGITRPKSTPFFGDKAVIKEGWLTLSPNQSHAKK